jgi:hypothetical protein
MTEQQRDTTDVTTANIGTTVPSSLPVFRSIIEIFRTDSFYTKGLRTQQITQTGAGARFLEMDNTYNVVTVPNGTGQLGLEDFTETRFPQLVRTDKLFYEGRSPTRPATRCAAAKRTWTAPPRTSPRTAASSRVAPLQSPT